jgi:hypothetical protein
MHALTLELFQDNQYECSYCGNYTRHADASDSDHTGALPPPRTRALRAVDARRAASGVQQVQ